METTNNMYEVSLSVKYITKKIGNVFNSCDLTIREFGNDLNEISILNNMYKYIKNILKNNHFIDSEPIHIRKEIILNGNYYDSDEWDIVANSNTLEIKILDLD